MPMTILTKPSAYTIHMATEHSWELRCAVCTKYTLDLSNT